MAKPNKKVWMARNKYKNRFGDFVGDYILFETKPKKDRYGLFRVRPPGEVDSCIDLFCPELFEPITGFTLKLGECKRVTIEIKPS